MRHAFSGESVKIFDAVKFLTVSFFPLASTAIIAYFLIFFISISFILLVRTTLMLANNFGFVIDYNSVYFMWFSAIMAAVLLAIIIHIHVEWSLAFALVVVESKWGFAALIRSSYLIKGMRSISLLVMLYFGVCGVFRVWVVSANRFVVLMMLGSMFLTLFLLRITAANTVLYNYCKGLHGELAIDCMNLPVDDEKKVPYVGALA